MRTATATDLGGDAGDMLRKLRAFEDSIRQAGPRHRAKAWQVRLIRWWLRKLMTP